jgi:hypothetical protein
MTARLLPYAPAVTGVVLLVVLLVGVVVGRAKNRWTLLAVGLVILAAAGVVLTAVADRPAGGAAAAPQDKGAELAALYTITLPLVVAYVAGWLLVRGGWLRRLLVVAVGAVLLVAFPYGAAGQATADAFLHGR